jgi:two-component system chemotaxis response regulator CheB
MASTLTRRNADVSLKALAAGAKDYVAKPSSTSQLTSASAFKEELIAKIKALAGSRRSPRIERPGLRPVEAKPGDAPHADRAPAERAPVERTPAERATAAKINRGGPVVLRPAISDVPEVLAIGSSTGGPQALFAVLGNLPANLTQPILITQHKPATFTTILAEHLTRTAKRPCAEAQDGEVLQRGRIYVAPGDFHMLVEAQGANKVLRLTKTPPENFCRPSVDPMLRSLATIYGRRLLVIILTGMGHDGLRGSEAVVQAGGWVVAQDEATSVVWGMPGAVATAGVCSAVMPVGEIGPFIQRIAMRSAA